MSDLIAADKAVDAEKWDLPTIAGNSGVVQHGLKPAERSAQALEELQKQAWHEGYADGQKKGQAEGKAAVDRQAKALGAIVEAIKTPLRDADEAFLQEMGRLAICLARALLGAELRLEPEHVLDLVRKAMSELPAESRKVRIELHPEDVVLVREHLPELEQDGQAVLRDQPHLARGECVVTSEGAHVDGTIQTRLAALAEQVLGDASADAAHEAPDDRA